MGLCICSCDVPMLYLYATDFLLVGVTLTKPDYRGFYVWCMNFT